MLDSYCIIVSLFTYRDYTQGIWLSINISLFFLIFVYFGILQQIDGLHSIDCGVEAKIFKIQTN